MSYIGDFELENEDDSKKIMELYDILKDDLNISFREFCGKLIIQGINTFCKSILDLKRTEE